jgi:hypothetical protein
MTVAKTPKSEPSCTHSPFCVVTRRRHQSCARQHRIRDSASPKDGIRGTYDGFDVRHSGVLLLLLLRHTRSWMARAAAHCWSGVDGNPHRLKCEIAHIIDTPCTRVRPHHATPAAPRMPHERQTHERQRSQHTAAREARRRYICKAHQQQQTLYNNERGGPMAREHVESSEQQHGRRGSGMRRTPAATLAPRHP